MAEQNSGQKVVGLSIKNGESQITKQEEADTAVSPDTLAVPVEFSSKNGAIHITNDGGVVTIDLAPVVVEEIGAYRRCPVKVRFQEGGGLQIIPHIV